MKGLSLFFSLCIIAVAMAAVANVVQFKVDEQERTPFDFLLSPRDHGKKPTRLGKYVYKNCGNPATYLANVSSLTFGPDPISFPGDLSVNFNITINKTLDSPLKGTVFLEKKVGDTWIKIPCIGSIGSCDYDDICDLLQNVVCPPEFDAHNIPCKCPFNQGKFVLPTTHFTVESAVFPSGDYHGVANLTYNDAAVACIELYATFD